MAFGNNILFSTEYIKNVLYFVVMKPGKVPKNTQKVHFFTIDDELVYENYYDDFGPLKLGCVYKYCKILNEKLKLYFHKQLIVHYTTTDPKKMANAAFLIASYGVLYLSLSPRDAVNPLLFDQGYRSFQDAVQGESYFTISLLDCIKAIKKARDLGFFNFHDFNYEEYEKLDQIHGGDRNWIVPGKFIAFVGPVDRSCSYHAAHMYIKYFKENNVTVVIRLNKKMYDENVFNNVGIEHYDLYFPDGECPPRHILLKFLEISEETPGAIGVHCKAGLGRTGSLIGAYLIKHYRMTAQEAIGWMRISRPGSVIGHQQAWLEKLEPWLHKKGDLYRKDMYQDRDRIPTHDFGVYSLAEKSYKYRPAVLHKSPSPPPPIGRYKRSETQDMRPQASRVRPVPKYMSRDPSEGINVVLMNFDKPTHTRNSRSRICPRMCADNNMNSCHNRPRSGNTMSQSVKTQFHPPSVIDAHERISARCNVSPVRPQSTTHRSRRTEAAINTSHTKNQSIGSYAEIDNNISKTKDSISIMRDNMPKSPSRNEKSPPRSPSITAFRRDGTSRMRRLGRSPSPPQIRQFEQSRATNTANPALNNGSTMDKLQKDPSLVALKEAILSMLKVVKSRQNSVGNSSLGARRGAPVPTVRASSVKSDNRQGATQGDILNSIKMQRRVTELSKHIKQDKFCVTPKTSHTSVIPQLGSTSRRYGYGSPVQYRSERSGKEQCTRTSPKINQPKTLYSVTRKSR